MEVIYASDVRMMEDVDSWIKVCLGKNYKIHLRINALSTLAVCELEKITGLIPVRLNGDREERYTVFDPSANTWSVDDGVCFTITREVCESIVREENELSTMLRKRTDTQRAIARGEQFA